MLCRGLPDTRRVVVANLREGINPTLAVECHLLSYSYEVEDSFGMPGMGRDLIIKRPAACSVEEITVTEKLTS